MNFSNLNVEPICDPYDLSLVIEYLRVNFKSSHKWAYSLFSHVLLMNKNKDLYGFKLIENNKLRGSILSINQGEFKDDSNKLFKVINTVCWSVDDELKGIPALMLLKHQVDYHKDSIITSFTVGGMAAMKVHYRLGFKDMNTFFSRFIPLNPLKVIAKDITIFECSQNEVKLEDEYIIQIKDQEDLQFFKIQQSNKKNIYFIGVKKIKLIKRIPLPHFLVLWSSENISSRNYKYKIWEYFYKKSNCLFIDFYQRSQNNYQRKSSARRNFLIKSPIDLDYYPPIGGELSLKEIIH